MIANSFEKSYERGRLKMLEERKTHPFSLSQLQFNRIKSPASEEEIEAVKNYFGHPLPELYKEICRHFNGGIPKAAFFEDVEGDIYEISFFCRVTNKSEKGYHILGVVKNFSHELVSDCLPFAWGRGESIFYLKWVNEMVQVWQLLYGELALEFGGYGPEDEVKPYHHILMNKSFDSFLESLYVLEA